MTLSDHLSTFCGDCGAVMADCPCEDRDTDTKGIVLKALRCRACFERSPLGRPARFDDRVHRLRNGYFALLMRLHVVEAMAEKAGLDLCTDFVRASGDCVCEACGETYGRHPEIRATFHVLCDGRLVKT